MPGVVVLDLYDTDQSGDDSVTINVGSDYSAEQPEIAVTYIASLVWEEVAWSGEVEIEEYRTSTGMAKLTNGADGYVVYPEYIPHEGTGDDRVPQPMEHTTVRVEVALGAPVPEGMKGTVRLAWYDPNNTVANISSPSGAGHGRRDNGERVALGEAGGVLPGFELEFRPRTTAEEQQDIGPETMDWRLRSYLVVASGGLTRST